MANSGIGAAVRRKEDHRFLIGNGNYVDDINRPGQTFAAIVRSPHAHATLGTIDTARATAAPGVITVLTGADVAADELGGLPCGWGITSKDGTPMIEPAWPILAQGKVRFVGDAVAAVIAETADQAKDAAELVEVIYTPLDAAVITAGATNPDAPQVHDEATNNTCFDFELGDKSATDELIGSAAHVTKLELVNQRVVPHSMEPRSAIGEFDASSQMMTLHATGQAPHALRLLLGAFVLQQPEHKFRVVCPDVGGGFGSKIYPYAEFAIVCWAARKLGRPVKWTSSRTEAYLTDAHGRDHVTTVELALDSNNKFTAMRVHTYAAMGAYLSALGPLIPTFIYATLFAGQYTTKAIYGNVVAVFTNTTPVDAFRGAGRPEASYLIERVIDKAAAELGVDPADLRRNNMIPPDAFPYETPVALHYDSGNYEQALDLAIENAGYGGFAVRREEAKSRGKLRGIGIASPIEATGPAPSNIAGALGARAGLYESGSVRFNATGSVTVISGAHSHGQGHETTMAQIISDHLGVPIENIEVVEGDTDKATMGTGTFGSRSTSVGGSALVKAADKIIDKGRKIAAHLLEASVEDIEFDSGTFQVAGTDKSIGIAEVAFAAYVPHNYPLEELEPGLDETAFFDPLNFNFPYATYICEVEVDPETGETDIVKFTAVDDVGNIINPMIVDGQVHGGVATGIGQAILENTVYDEMGQLVSGSLMDYTLPRADDLPNIDTENTVTPCPLNPLGVKGVGEIGTIGAPPAVINAVVNALDDFGVKHVDMPATPQRIWQAIQSASAA